MQFLIVLLFVIGCVRTQTPNPQPHIILIMADDLGRNDVSFTGNNQFIVTPNLDALAYNGIILSRFHSHATCIPSRGALMTGKFSTRLGLQHNDLPNDEPWGLSPYEKLLPQYLREVGYRTHLVGKWHLGFYKRYLNPMRRGFDSYYGNLGDYVKYQSHELCMPNHPFWPAGYDMRKNESIDYTTKGQHVTELFTNRAVEIVNNHNLSEPLFLWVSHLAPHSEDWLCPFPESDECWNYLHILNPIQRRLAGQIVKMDTNIGYLIGALENRNMLNNSVIVFLSDNGAQSIGCGYTFGSNYPLRGQKNTPFEGATRVPAFIWSPLLNNNQYVSNRLVHITDLFTTLGNLGKANFSDLTFGLDFLQAIENFVGYNQKNVIDGLDVWNMLSNNTDDVRTRMVHNIDDYISYTSGEWKYIRSTPSCAFKDGWIGHTIQHDCLFNYHKNDYYDSVRNSVAARLLVKYTKDGQELSNDLMNSLQDQARISCTKCIKCCMPWLYPCLFNIRDDPCEHENLFFTSWMWKAIQLELEVDIIRTASQSPRNDNSDCNANPKDNEYVWTWWQGFE